MTASSTELVSDPVSHISISGFHNQDEVDERVAYVSKQERRAGRRSELLGTVLLGAAIGAVVMYLVTSKR